MKRILILDDMRSEKEAIASGKWPFGYQDEHETTIARTYDDGMNIIETQPAFDLWILDHDLGARNDGYDFIKNALASLPEKAPKFCFSCSANPPGRANIEGYWKSWKDHA